MDFEEDDAYYNDEPRYAGNGAATSAAYAPRRAPHGARRAACRSPHTVRRTRAAAQAPRARARGVHLHAEAAHPLASAP